MAILCQDADMSQGHRPNDDEDVLEERVGYVLKQAVAALRTALDSVLRPHDLTLPQYACLELLGRTPGLSNSQLARGAFVTRQSMIGVVRGLQGRGLVTRPAVAARGRSLPTRLTPAGQALLRTAGADVQDIETRMVAGLGPEQRESLVRALSTCIAGLTQDHG